MSGININRVSFDEIEEYMDLQLNLLQGDMLIVPLYDVAIKKFIPTVYGPSSGGGTVQQTLEQVLATHNEAYRPIILFGTDGSHLVYSGDGLERRSSGVSFPLMKSIGNYVAFGGKIDYGHDVRIYGNTKIDTLSVDTIALASLDASLFTLGTGTIASATAEIMTVSNALIVPILPINSNEAASKDYVDTVISAPVPPNRLIPSGGLEGDVLTKGADDNYDVTWKKPESGGGTTGDYLPLDGSQKMQGQLNLDANILKLSEDASIVGDEGDVDIQGDKLFISMGANTIKGTVSFDTQPRVNGAEVIMVEKNNTASKITRIWTGTSSEYANIPSVDIKDTTMYVIVD
ncbi:MAG: hypothetical protein KAH32_00495 [Chlamydiia bacterium]|nr:hypothetical protein [Chlamydiia bacterium]